MCSLRLGIPAPVYQTERCRTRYIIRCLFGTIVVEQRNTTVCRMLIHTRMLLSVGLVAGIVVYTHTVLKDLASKHKTQQHILGTRQLVACTWAACQIIYRKSVGIPKTQQYMHGPRCSLTFSRGVHSSSPKISPKLVGQPGAMLPSISCLVIHFVLNGAATTWAHKG